MEKVKPISLTRLVALDVLNARAPSPSWRVMKRLATEQAIIFATTSDHPATPQENLAKGYLYDPDTRRYRN